ncbi:uncharacterized protein LOC117654544 [Thrips palmi]|uniref:Uncharacterized protein LOC117654544 n=1 Tax=Thrips palmi TaxID=161013 RepID=A0A6P9AIC0_THRPL|nr:uncharacterized protein LOC117654544 [Thrips palmi]
MAMAARTLLASLGVLLLAAAVCAQDKLDKLDKRASADADIDRLTDDALAGIATFAKDTGLVSLNLPDVDQHFSTTVAWILSITGNLQLMNGLLTNFQTIHRFEDSLLTFIESTQADNPNELVLRVGIEIPEIDVRSVYPLPLFLPNTAGLKIVVGGQNASRVLAASTGRCPGTTRAGAVMCCVFQAAYARTSTRRKRRDGHAERQVAMATSVAWAVPPSAPPRQPPTLRASSIEAFISLYGNVGLYSRLTSRFVFRCRKINVKVKDGVVGWLATFISNLVVGFVKNNVKNAIEHQLPSVINDILAKLDIADMIRPHLAPRLAL